MQFAQKVISCMFFIGWLHSQECEILNETNLKSLIFMYKVVKMSDITTAAALYIGVAQ